MTERDDIITPLLRRAPRLGLALGLAPAKAGPVADDAMQMDVQKTLYPFHNTTKMPHVTVTLIKNALWAAIAR